MNRLVLRCVGCCVGLFSLGASPGWSADNPAASDIQPLLQQFCVSCHGPETSEAGLRFDRLPFDFEDSAHQTRWIKVFDRVTAGEMPPMGSEQPAAGVLNRATARLRQELHRASRRQQQTEGRVLLRRLNNTEYENTVRQLIGTNVTLQDMLPDENATGGFDNVSAGLELSAAHLLLYQEAAEKAVRSAIPLHPHLPILERRTGKQMSDLGGNFRQTLTRSCYLKEEALIVYSKLPRYGLVCTPHVNGKGVYRIRMSIAAVGEGYDTVPAALMTVDRGREPPVLRDCLDIPAGAPQVVELDAELEDGQAFVVNLLYNWDIRAFRKPIEEYTGPGLLIEWLEIEGPVNPFPSVAYQTLFGEAPLIPLSAARAQREGRRVNVNLANRNIWSWRSDPLESVSTQPEAESERLIRAFAVRAFRRPVSEELLQHYVGLVHRKLAAGASSQDAMIYGYKAILTSPHFLFLVEPGDLPVAEEPPTASLRLDDFALANRLSYFLWTGPPDDTLLELARQRTLSQPAELRRQVDRMLADPRARNFTRNFTGQWLDLRKMDDTIPDPNLYGDFDGMLLWSMPLETYHVFEELLRTDESLLNFVAADWTFLNERLANHYGIPDVHGNTFRRVKLPADSHRGGVLTQASVLKVTADGTTTSPVLRGKWVLEQILGQPPAPPPPDIPAIEPDIRGATTIREQLEKHREIESCASCHRHIDPPGFALESFDPIGGYREFYRASARTPGGLVMLANYTGRPIYRGRDVEVGAETAEGRRFSNVDEYKALLLENPDQIARNLTAKLLTYATGAEPQFADREVIDQIVARLRTQHYGFRSLIHEIVQSPPFQHK